MSSTTAEGHDGDEGLISTGFHTNDNVGDTANAYSQSLAKWNSTITTGGGSAKVYDTNIGDTTPATANGGVQVINQTGAELPSTGGIGTTIFYVAGTVLVVGAVVMLVAKRRMGSEA